MKRIKNTIQSRRHIKKHISDQFAATVGYSPNLSRPRTFNEKIQWLKINYRDPLLTKCADKYAAREYISETIGEEHLVKILGVYDDVSEIDFNSLPNQFVLKANNGSGTNIICHDKDKLNIEESKHKLADWLRPEASHYYYSYEWCYKDIAPKIICEEYIQEMDGELKDYKFLCFKGKPQILFVCSDRKTDLKVDFFDLDWQRLPFKRYYKNSKKQIQRPETFDLMVQLAEELAKPFPFVRVDMYEIKGKVYIGELTFYPGNGMESFTPSKWDYELGELLPLPMSHVWKSWWKDLLSEGST